MIPMVTWNLGHSNKAKAEDQNIWHTASKKKLGRVVDLILCAVQVFVIQDYGCYNTIFRMISFNSMILTNKVKLRQIISKTCNKFWPSQKSSS